MGKVFADKEKVKNVVEGLVKDILQGENKKDFLEKKIKVLFEIRDPAFSFMLDPKKADVYSEEINDNVDITISMEGDFMHNFWLKRTNILESIKKGDFKVQLSSGIGTARLIDLLPVLAKGLDLYPDICRKNDIAI